MKQQYQKIKNLATKILISLGAFISSTQMSFAGLPTMEAPSKGEGAGLFETLKNYGYDFILYGGLLVSAIAFLKVATAALETFGEVRAGKKGWGEFGMICGVGVILLVVIIWLITKAVDILN
ncbi:TIGR03745 family integrating conjugative element membrane protein [Avibacterium sp. 21-599]|uniref:TIGR03745 family integrating conjugative element membrane protein n=1 Tax=Avibacterium sp. 21-599 TaxID=2911528 RepID=UPI0022457CA2|nr:TIGR03745 family integrating conjugative element membrane protein [Avibacterium sp. 21-599]MCW9718549.1 TIGR03745 family integrating conjugative element membrane protein [Avibacterium sp. 21-599]